jgi:hypothetical protein
MGSLLQGLVGSGIQLQDSTDELHWIGGDKSGLLSVKNVYWAIATKIWQQKTTGWRRKLWIWDLALKIKLFIWLVVENKILTWDNLQGRGWEGPNICHLCLKEPETVNHLLVNCYFTQQVWHIILRGLKI